MAAVRTRRDGGNRYRKRRPMPAIAAFVVLAVLAAVVWVTVVQSSVATDSSVTCTPPAGGKPLGKTVEPSALDTVTPAATSGIKVTVLNAAQQRGEAGIVAAILKQSGFSKASADNDKHYKTDAMDCRGQIRFGAAGKSAARTISLLEPCSQLIQDSRKNASVDFAIGKKFDDLRPTAAAEKALAQINKSAGHSDTAVDQKLFQQARDSTTCG